MGRGFFIALVGLLLAACAPPAEPPGQRIDGLYYIASPVLSPQGGVSVCYKRPLGRCDIRAPAPVRRIGFDDDYIAVETARPGDPAAEDYYLIVRLFDAPEADGARCLSAERETTKEQKKAAPLSCDKLKTQPKNSGVASNCAVRGPFDRREFDALRRCHCVPVALGSTTEKCIPDATIPVTAP